MTWQHEAGQAKSGTNVGTAFTEQLREFWKESVDFKGLKVFRRDDVFDPNHISTWTVNRKKVTGTNVERMAAGRAPIGIDGEPINLHHLIQKK